MATYIIRAGLTGPVKIGRTDDVEQRRRILQTGNPEDLHILRVIDTPFDAEPAMHARFADRRIRGEWFEFDVAMLTFMPVQHEALPAQTALGRLMQFLGRLGKREVAQRVGASVRSVEGWIAGKNGPNARYVLRMLNDRQLAPGVLAALGREELVNPDETILNLALQVRARFGEDHPVLKRPDVVALLEKHNSALKAALVSEGK